MCNTRRTPRKRLRLRGLDHSPNYIYVTKRERRLEPKHSKKTNDDYDAIQFYEDFRRTYFVHCGNYNYHHL